MGLGMEFPAGAGQTGRGKWQRCSTWVSQFRLYSVGHLQRGRAFLAPSFISGMQDWIERMFDWMNYSVKKPLYWLRQLLMEKQNRTSVFKSRFELSLEVKPGIKYGWKSIIIVLAHIYWVPTLCWELCWRTLPCIISVSSCSHLGCTWQLWGLKR